MNEEAALDIYRQAKQEGDEETAIRALEIVAKIRASESRKLKPKPVLRPQTQGLDALRNQGMDNPLPTIARDPLGAAQTAAQGATLGFSDELAGLGVAAAQKAFNPEVSGVPFGDVYRGARDVARQQVEDVRQSQPGLAIGSELAGGLLTGGALTKAGAMMPQAVRDLPMLAKSLPVGAAIGGTVGLGASESETLGGLLRDTGEGAAAGALVGTALPIGAGMFRYAQGKVAPGVAGRMNAMGAATGMTPEQIGQRLGAIGPRAVLADTNDVFRNAADAAAARLGPTMAAAGRNLANRSRGQLGRIMDPIRKSIGGIDKRWETVDALKAAKKEVGSPLYQQAFREGVENTGELRRLLEKPAVQAAWRKAKTSGLNDPETVLTKEMVNRAEPTLEGWQYIVERLSDKANSLARSGQNKEAFTLSNLRRTILRELDAQNSTYGQARRVWSSASRADDMIQEGEKFFTAKPDEMERMIRDMSEADKEFFRVGVGRAVENKLSASGDTHDLTKFFRNPAMRRKLRQVFPDNRSYAEFLNTVEAESQMQMTARKVAQGSQTHQRGVVARQLGGKESVDAPMSRMEAVRAFLSRMGGPTNRTTQQIGGLLLSDDPAVQQQALGLLRQQISSPVPGLVPPGALLGGLLTQ